MAEAFDQKWNLPRWPKRSDELEHVRPGRTVELTSANQSLHAEIADSNHVGEIASRHGKPGSGHAHQSEFLANMSHEIPHSR